MCHYTLSNSSCNILSMKAPGSKIQDRSLPISVLPQHAGYNHCSHHHPCLNCDWLKTLNPCWNYINRSTDCQTPKISQWALDWDRQKAFQYSPQQVFHKGRVNFVPKFTSSLFCRDALNGSVMCRTDTYLYVTLTIQVVRCQLWINRIYRVLLKALITVSCTHGYFKC